MTNIQLQLINTDTTWRLDGKTIKAGRAGVANARAALAKSKRPAMRATANISSLAA